MRRTRPNPRERIDRIFERIRKLENRLIAKSQRMPVEERDAFDATEIAKINAIMKKAVQACIRVASRPRTVPKKRRKSK